MAFVYYDAKYPNETSPRIGSMTYTHGDCAIRAWSKALDFNYWKLVRNLGIFDPHITIGKNYEPWWNITWDSSGDRRKKEAIDKFIATNRWQRTLREFPRSYDWGSEFGGFGKYVKDYRYGDNPAMYSKPYTDPPTSVGDFAKSHPIGTYVISCENKKASHDTGHATCIVNGVIYDTWDPSEWTVRGWWLINENKVRIDKNNKKIARKKSNLFREFTENKNFTIMNNFSIKIYYVVGFLNTTAFGGGYFNITTRAVSLPNAAKKAKDYKLPDGRISPSWKLIKDLPDFVGVKAFKSSEDADKYYNELKSGGFKYLELLVNQNKNFTTVNNFDLSDVETKWSPPEGFFKQSAKKIAEGLKANSKDKAQAMRRLTFYINRAGSNLSDEDKNRLELAKTKLRNLYEKGFSVNKNFSITNIYGIEFETIKDYAERHDLDVNHLVSLASSNGEPLSSDVRLPIMELDYYATHCRKSQQFTEVWTYPMEQIEVAGNLLKALKKYIETFDNDEFKRHASESGGVSPHVAQQLYDAVAKNFRIPGPLYGADSLCFSNKNFSKSINERFTELARSVGVPIVRVEIDSAKPDDKIFPRDYWLLRFHLNDHFTLEFYFKDGKWGCGTRCTNESCPEKGKILDALNKYYPNGIGEDKNFGYCDEKLTLYVNDPDGTIKKMLKLISSSSLAGHTFDVIVDPDNKDTEDGFYGKFEIDGDGADKIKFMED